MDEPSEEMQMGSLGKMLKFDQGQGENGLEVGDLKILRIKRRNGSKLNLEAI